MQTLFTCPCCAYLTLESEVRGRFEICPVCLWEDGNLQFQDPEFAGGANEPSLRQAQANFHAYGASDEKAKDLVRKPRESEVPR